MIVTYAAMGVGQFLLNVADSSGFSRFILVSALISFALVPLSLVPAEAPSLTGARSVSVDEIFKASPLAVVATFLSGLTQSSLFAMGPVFGLMQGLSLPYVSLMMALPPLAVIVSQYPAGLISDRYDRRTVIMAMSAAAASVAAVSIVAGALSPITLIVLMGLFGGICLPIYSLVIAHANDHLQREQILGASAKLVMLYGLGSMLGPSLMGQVMQRLGPPGFMTFMAVVYVAMAGLAFWRRLVQPLAAKTAPDDAIKAGPLTTPVAAQAIAESSRK
jgi:MFS family permease